MKLYISKKLTKKIEKTRDKKTYKSLIRFFELIESSNNIHELSKETNNINKLVGVNRNIFSYRLNVDKRLIFSVESNEEGSQVIIIDLVNHKDNLMIEKFLSV